MTPEEYIRLGKLDEAMASLRDAIRNNPAEPKLRVFLFQLLSVNGEWEKALTQLNLIADISADSKLLAEIFRPVVQCEALRAEVFAGNRSPLIFGEPQEWIGLLVHANSLAATGKLREARTLLDKALETAPAVAGSFNGHGFEWIADADSRLGPVLEAVIDGKYYWVPFNRIAQIHFSRPSDLRDLVWISATFTWANGGESSGLVPVRYPGSEVSQDPSVRLARKTEWKDAGEGFYFGQGQRVLATDTDEYPLLEALTVTFNHPADPSSAPVEPAAG